MRAVGLVTEYNPFHNGHRYHLQQSCQAAAADVSVAVMSGHFLQRGEPALLDKWQRAQMAIVAGVDLVLELPLPWACDSAPTFADGAIRSLQACRVDAVCFGSESGSLDDLQQGATWLRRHAGLIARESRAALRQGLNWPHARAAIAADSGAAPAVLEALRHPNNILGLEYLRALSEAGSEIEPMTIRRIGAGYHDVTAVDAIASATGIRALLASGDPVAAYLPPAVAELLATAIASGMAADSGWLFRHLLYALQREESYLERLYQSGNGMSRRLQTAAGTASDYASLVDMIKSRHLTRTRVQRLLSYVLLDLERGIARELLDCGPLYLHLLGMTSAGEAFLAQRRKEIELPIISNYSRIQNQLMRFYAGQPERLRLAREQLEIELRATRIYSLLQPGFAGRSRNRDYFDPVLRAGR